MYASYHPLCQGKMKESPLRVSELLLPVGVDLLLGSAVKVLIKEHI